MHWLDYIVLAGYFIAVILIGVWSSRRIQVQEDYFMGSRSFGKLLQTFAAFGAGTGSSDPVNIGRTTYTSGMSGMWSIMSLLFVTPFYWITGVWYRRMRHLTLGDWFVERYESRALGAAYCIFGLFFFVVYGSMMFSAIGKVAAPLVGASSFILAGKVYGIEYLLVPVIGLVVLVYGIAGGLRAAYFTDLMQGIFIILLSVLLIPFGLQQLVQQFGNPASDGLLAGFRILHEQLPDAYFTLAGSTTASEFPLHRIIAVGIISLVGVVVQPHFIATGGGSAKTEFDARVGLVTGNLLKRFCTIGWVITALIALALFADNPQLLQDPDKTWGVASRELLGPGLTGLMLSCLLAALMSSADAFMIIGSSLVVRNVYAPFINPNGSEREYVLLGRITGIFVVGGAVAMSLSQMNVFKQLQLTWVYPLIFAAPFWIGMFWRRATTTAAWSTVLFCVATFFAVPFLLPIFAPGLRTNPVYTVTSPMIKTIETRQASPSDVKRVNVTRARQIARWQQQRATIQQTVKPDQQPEAIRQIGPKPELMKVGDLLQSESAHGGTSVFWTGGVQPVDAAGNRVSNMVLQPVGAPREINAHRTEIVLHYPADTRLQGSGNFKLDFLIYRALGVDLEAKRSATLGTLELPLKIVLPFLVMILVSLVTRRNNDHSLNRYYAKMKTPVTPNHEQDEKNLVSAYSNPGKMEQEKLFPGTDFEFQKPTFTDVAGFVVSVAACCGIIALAAWIAGIGS